MSWEIKNNQAIYPQLVEIIKRRIIAGVYPPGERLPSVRELAEDSGVNPNTMQRALVQLESEGLLNTRRTSGRFVSEDISHLNQMKTSEAQKLVSAFRLQMAKLGYDQEAILELLSAKGEEQ